MYICEKIKTHMYVYMCVCVHMCVCGGVTQQDRTGARALALPQGVYLHKHHIPIDYRVHFSVSQVLPTAF